MEGGGPVRGGAERRALRQCTGRRAEERTTRTGGGARAAQRGLAVSVYPASRFPLGSPWVFRKASLSFVPEAAGSQGQSPPSPGNPCSALPSRYQVCALKVSSPQRALCWDPGSPGSLR